MRSMEKLEKKLNEIYNKVHETKEVSAVDIAEVNMIYEEIEERYLMARKLRDSIRDYQKAQIRSIMAVQDGKRRNEK